MENENLFEEFPPVSTQEWKRKISKDLKGADFEKKLVWHTGEGFDVQPYYRGEDLKEIPHIKTFPTAFLYFRGKSFKGNHWKINEFIQVIDSNETVIKATNALQKGADSLTFSLPETFLPGKQALSQLLNGIDLEKTPVHFQTSQPLLLIKNLTALVKERRMNPEKIEGSLFCDPLTQISRNGRFVKSEEDALGRLEKLLKASEIFPLFQTLTIDAGLFHNSGANIVTEMACALSTGAFYLDYLSEKGFSPEVLFGKMRFGFAVGSNYFMEIAKFRALRYLWAKIAESYGITGREAAMIQHATNSHWNKTLYDPYVNMLRTTTEIFSAVTGGADEITTQPFDVVNPQRPEMAARIARNQQLILREESYLNKVGDVAAGSYYIETLTEKLIKEAWQLFLEIEETGGYLKSFKKGIIQERIKEEAREKDLHIALRKRNILGVNQFPNLTEHLTDILPDDFFSQPPSENTEPPPLIPYRGAAAFEWLRYQTDRYAMNNRRPKVWMFTYGNLAIRRERAQFAGSFFGCAGYEIIDNNGFATVEEGIIAAKTASPDMVVLCSSDEEYKQLAMPVFEALKNKTVVVLAGNPKSLIGELKEKGFEHFIHTQSNVLEELRKFQKLLKID